MKTFSGKILSPKVTILHFSHRNVGMISYTLYFLYNNSLLQGHENYRTLIFVVIDFDPEKIERKGGARFLAFSRFIGLGLNLTPGDRSLVCWYVTTCKESSDVRTCLVVCACQNPPPPLQHSNHSYQDQVCSDATC